MRSEQGLLGPAPHQGLVPYGAPDEFGQGCISGDELSFSQSCMTMGMHVPPYVAIHRPMLGGVAQGCMSFGAQGEVPSLGDENQRTLSRFGGQGEVPLLPDDDSPPLPPPAAARQHPNPNPDPDPDPDPNPNPNPTPNPNPNPNQLFTLDVTSRCFLVRV